MCFETLLSSGLLLKMRMGMIRSENAFDEYGRYPTPQEQIGY
jgi:hypothetical protein